MLARNADGFPLNDTEMRSPGLSNTGSLTAFGNATAAPMPASNPKKNRLVNRPLQPSRLCFSSIGRSQCGQISISPV